MANEYLKRTPTSTGNRKVWTLSTWVKQSAVERMVIFGSRNNSTNPYTLIRTSSPTINWEFSIDAGADGGFEGVKKDVASWYNLVVSIDTTLEDDADRIRYYVNGEKLNYASTQASVTKNTELNVNEIRQHVFGVNPGYSQYWKGEILDAFLVDGQALTPEVFGFYKDGKGYISAGSTQATDFRPGQWVPKTPRVIKAQIERNGGFGVNGFYLPMNDSSNFGADFHTTPNSIITLKGENLPQPRNGAPETTDAYVSQLRTDPYAANLVLAVPGIGTAIGADIVSNGYEWTGASGTTPPDDWTTTGSTATYSVNTSGQLVYDRNGDGTGDTAKFSQDLTTVNGKVYHLVLDLVARTTGGFVLDVGGAINVFSSTTDTGIKRYTFTATSTTTTISMRNSAASGTLTIDNVKVRQVDDAPLDYSADIKGSGTNKTLTANGNTGVGYEIPSYYGSALSSDGSGDYLDAGSSSDFDFGNGDFTVEYWQNVNSFAGTPGLGIWDDTNNQRSWTIYQNTSGLPRFYVNTDGTSSGSISVQVSVTISTNQWNHFCMERNGSNLLGYVNGVCVGINTNLGTQSLFTPADPFLIGNWATASSYYIDGYIQDLRVYKGVAKYKGGFDVPKPYTPVGIATWRAVPDTTANNFCTMNSINHVGATFANGNLTTSEPGSSGAQIYATMGSNTGKWYYEAYVQNVGTPNAGGTLIGINPLIRPSSNVQNRTAYRSEGSIYNDSGTSVGNSGLNYVAGDTIGVAWDADNKRLWFAENNTWVLSGNPAGGSNPTITYTNTETQGPFIAYDNGTGAQVTHLNFGQNPTFSGNTTAGTFTDSNGKGLFKYQPPSGFLALCEDNLPTPAISDPGEYFRSVLWTGDGSSGRSITGVGFKPDLVWFKARNTSTSHVLNDTVRGITEHLNSDDTVAASTPSYPYLNSVDNNGFSLLGGSSSGGNIDGRTYVAWCWRAGAGTTSTNTDGSITSVVSVNQDAGFSIVSYTGNATDSTVGHGLNKTPGFIIVKKRNGGSDWVVYHQSLATQEYLVLNLTNGKNTTTELFYQDPTSSVFYIGDASNAINASGGTYISYCWAEIEGFSKFGSYVGNESADGPFVYCGFKPAWVMVKRSNAGENWAIIDSSRNSTNVATNFLRPDETTIETTGAANMDLLSNGFKLRGTDTKSNGSGSTYIFAAFAESPFQTANAK